MRFTARSLRTRIAAGTVVLIRPETHRAGAPAPLLPPGTAFSIGNAKAVVVSDTGFELILSIDGHPWRLTPLTPVEIDMSVTFIEGVGLREWVVRGWA